MAIPTILKGETSKPIPLALADGYDYAGCSLHVNFCGLRKTFGDLAAGGTVELGFTAEETVGFPLGTSKVMLSLENANGEIRFMPWAKVKVTDSPEDLYDATITIDPATLDVADLTNADSLGVVKSRLNAVMAFLRGLKVLAFALVPLGAMANVEPVYTTLNDMPGDAKIMTNVTDYIDAKIVELAPKTSLKPATNYTDFALGSFAATGAVKRAETYGTPTRWTDATGCVWEVMINVWFDHMDGNIFVNGVSIFPSDLTAGDMKGYLYYDPSAMEYVGETGGGWYYNGENTSGSPSGVLVGGPDATSLDGGRLTLGDLTNLVGRVALTADIPPETDLAPIEEEIGNIRAESQIVYRLYQGSNVVAEVTNYNSSVHAPELRLMQLNESNEYITVWAETNGLSRTLASARQYTDDATGAVVQAVAPRAWSKVTAGMGVEAPSNTTWLSTARTVIAGGLDYEKHVTSGGAIWLLESNGMTPDFHPQTNNTAFLDLANADGTPIFRVEKTDSFLVGVHIDDVTVDGNALVCSVGVVAAEHPLVRVRASLSSGDWIKEEDGIPASLATVTWSGSTGNWTCRVQNNTGGGQFFAQMEYLQEGGTKIVNSAPMSVSAGILCTDGIHKCRPVYSNGSITWEVVP